MAELRVVEIRGASIRLGQFLKLAGLVDAGSDAKVLLSQGDVWVNGEPEHRRGRQLRPGDLVTAGDERVQVAAEA
ncbi:MAG TPA: RNA-binding S4 domain-containing protein [Nocardioidaceae bacterium]|nr:RNA-binding S4 domain-containing protein [Nocardioidaceae bacterium]